MPSACSSRVGMTCVLPPFLRDQVVNNLLRFISKSPEPVQCNNLVQRARGSLWERASGAQSNVKLLFFRCIFASGVGNHSLTNLCISAELYNVFSSYKPGKWHIQNIRVLHSMVEKGFLRCEMRFKPSLRAIV